MDLPCRIFKTWLYFYEKNKNIYSNIFIYLLLHETGKHSATLLCGPALWTNIVAIANVANAAAIYFILFNAQVAVLWYLNLFF